MAYPYEIQEPLARETYTRSQRLSRHIAENRMRYMGVFGVVVIIAALVFLLPMWFAPS